jgi:hypothetical protein
MFSPDRSVIDLASATHELGLNQTRRPARPRSRDPAQPHRLQRRIGRWSAVRSGTDLRPDRSLIATLALIGTIHRIPDDAGDAWVAALVRAAQSLSNG